MATKVTILVDGDPIVYRVGFSLEKRTYYLQWRDVDPAHPDEPEFDREHIAFFWNAAARDEYIRLQNLHPDEYHSEMVPVPERDDAIVYGRVKNVLRDIETQIGAHLYEDSREVRDVELYLSGKTNYRNNIATIVPYKISRIDAPKPVHYQKIRDYLIQRCGAIVTDGIEADDAVAIRQSQAKPGSTVIATIDKDLKGIRGYHYNLGKKTMRYITTQDADVFFYRQILTGDRTDDIPGCYKIGDGTANKIIKISMSLDEMWSAVVDAYYQNLDQYPAHHGHYGEEFTATSNYLERKGIAARCALENARLLWMQRAPNQLWTPPHVEFGKVSDFLAEQGLDDPDEDWV